MSGFDLAKAGPLRTVVRRVFAKDSTLSLSARAVAVVLADHANAEGIAWPSYETIAERTGLGRSTVARAIRALTSGSFPIFAKHRRGQSNVYEVVRSPAAFVEGREDSRTVPIRDSKTVPRESREPSRFETRTRPDSRLVPVPIRDPKSSREEFQGREIPPPPPQGEPPEPRLRAASGAASAGPTPGAGGESDRTAGPDLAVEAEARRFVARMQADQDGRRSRRTGTDFASVGLYDRTERQIEDDRETAREQIGRLRATLGKEA